MAKIEMRFVEDAQEGNLAAARKVWTQLADRLDALDADERELLRAALRNLGAGIPAAKAFMPDTKRARGGLNGRGRTAGKNYYAMHLFYLERLDAGDDEATAKRGVASRFGCTLRNAQRAIKVTEEQ